MASVCFCWLVPNYVCAGVVRVWRVLKMNGNKDVGICWVIIVLLISSLRRTHHGVILGGGLLTRPGVMKTFVGSCFLFCRFVFLASDSSERSNWHISLVYLFCFGLLIACSLVPGLIVGGGVDEGIMFEQMRRNSKNCCW